MYQKEVARELERRRAVELMDRGETTELIARTLGVSVNSRYKWHKIHRDGAASNFHQQVVARIGYQKINWSAGC